MEKKYVMIEGSWGKFPIVFSAVMNHNDVAEGVGGKVVSAGFFYTRIEDGKIKVTCYGKSQTLKLGPDKDDALYLEMLLNDREGAW